MPALPAAAPATRAARADALLRLPPPVLRQLAHTAPLRAALPPFRRKADAAYDASAFLHAFGVRGPRDAQWHALFDASGALRPEDIAVVVAFAACGAKADMDVVRETVVGGAAPGVLDMVCDRYDEWLLSDGGLGSLLAGRVERAAREWDVQVVDGAFVWRCEGVGEGVMTECSLVQAVEKCAGKIVEGEIAGVVQEVARRVSFGGGERVMRGLSERATCWVEAARQKAKGVLVDTVFEVMAETSNRNRTGIVATE